MLEKSFGTTLFLRSRTGMSLTEAGFILLAHARKVMLLQQEVMSKLTRSETDLKGSLRIGASTTIMQYYLPKILAAFKKKYIAVKVEVLENNSTGIISALLGQRIDLGLIESPCRRRDLRTQHFFNDKIIVIASPDHHLAKKHAISSAELAKQAFVFREQGSGTRQYVEENLQCLKINPKKLLVIQELSSTEAIKRAVAENMGLGFVSRLSVTHELAHGSLVVLPIKDLKIERYFSTILPLGSDPVGLRQVFLNFLN